MSANSKGISYWITQIAVSAVFAIGAPITGVLMFSLKPDEPGMGVILILIGIAFFFCLLWLIRAYRSMSKQQRAIYAWAIAQQMAATDVRNPKSDGEAMTVASQAKDGALSPGELAALQALRPEVPYPGAAAAPTVRR
ncbi:hypothetical protein EYE40_03190 [Glaciihabitans arcticus]|uniref:Uncharacterized protein n=1 Tax=Glaciihabitans arcticus TaxID=2668039 RepID=A0A4Q9GV48_9MICO|nr:hypothetical protein [Glaciihabitans arcticus]TBN56483.1 hypothetical protein EYE40_03190 [Glaciihabitans arcticus]